jgi:rhodanese-related sulfurtransferase
VDRKLIAQVAVAAVTLVIVATLLIPMPKPAASWPASGDVTLAALRDLGGRGARIVDVRTVAEFGAGHIDGAVSVPVGDLPADSAAWDKATAIIVYCETGARSKIAAQYLKARGFAHVYDLPGGIVASRPLLVRGASASMSGVFPATERPTMYEFATDS